MLNPDIISFLSELKKKNNKDWFNKNKDRYLDAKLEFEKFVSFLILEINKIDKTVGGLLPKDCTFRIYRDVRFSRDKEPYKPNFGAYISNGGKKSIYAGYYLHIEHNNSFIGGGIYMPQPNALKAVRDEILENSSEFKKIVSNNNFKKYFPEIYGEKLKNAPRGFPKDFEDVELLKHKSYTVLHHMDDDLLSNPKFMEYITAGFKEMHIFNNYINNAINHSI